MGRKKHKAQAQASTTPTPTSPPIDLANNEAKVPGFGLPLSYYHTTSTTSSAERPFPSALCANDLEEDTALPLTTLRELTMLMLMNRISDKPAWNTKIFDATIAARWRQEALEHEDKDVTPRMIDAVIDELRYKSKRLEKMGPYITVFNGDVVKSDSALADDFKHQLQDEIKSLEDVPAKCQDWHPGSDKQILDLVHPSLFPLIYGRSRVLKNDRTTLDECAAKCGEGEVLPIPSEMELAIPGRVGYNLVGMPYSRKFQWLPCEVDISGYAKITSYVNNLHPELHQSIYSLVEEVIDSAIPMWNISLSATVERNWKPRIVYRGQYQDNPAVVPDAAKFNPPGRVKKLAVDLRKQFFRKGLQVIVKFANIVLTPEKPNYPGGAWHVEGQLNEHICASALYYYSNENIERSKLAFRQQSNVHDVDAIKYPQDDHAFFDLVFGCRNGQPGVQEVGDIVTQEGRLITFPNILQHQVRPFGLKDPTKPGHRKILALFLVDPHIRVLSTANVPPQQREWWSAELNKTDTGLNRLPQEVKDLIFEEVQDDFPIGPEEAKALRDELMEERKGFQIQHGNAFTSIEFSLCEH